MVYFLNSWVVLRINVGKYTYTMHWALGYGKQKLKLWELFEVQPSKPDAGYYILELIVSQLMVDWWFGARWFGFLGSPFDPNHRAPFPTNLPEFQGDFGDFEGDVFSLKSQVIYADFLGSIRWVISREIPGTPQGPIVGPPATHTTPIRIPWSMGMVF